MRYLVQRQTFGEEGGGGGGGAWVWGRNFNGMTYTHCMHEHAQWPQDVQMKLHARMMLHVWSG